VQFTDISTGEPTSWQWTFPGGTFSGRTPPAQAIPAHTPPESVTLTVANPAGSDVVSAPVVVNGPPTAALTITPNPVGANTPVTLNASASTDPNGDPLSYS
jgi:PKD repeat protein